MSRGRPNGLRRAQHERDGAYPTMKIGGATVRERASMPWVQYPACAIHNGALPAIIIESTRESHDVRPVEHADASPQSMYNIAASSRRSVAKPCCIQIVTTCL